MVPANIQERLTYFENTIAEKFEFLAELGYTLKEKTTKQDEEWLDYHATVIYNSGGREISFTYTTDIINAAITKFLNITQRPNIDNLISVSISDGKAFLIVGSYIEKCNPEMEGRFTIPLASTNVLNDIARVLDNYKEYLQTELNIVLLKKRMYNCYTNKDFEIVVEVVK